MTLLSTLLQGGQGGGYGQEHGGGYESGPEGLGSIAEIPDYITHHLEDGRYIEFAGMKLDLAPYAFEPLHIGALTLDFSPTRQLIFIFLAAFICIALFVPLARATTRREEGKAPSGLANAMERQNPQ